MDANRFKQFFLPYHAKLYRIAFRLTGNREDAEDMVQEAYIKLWNRRTELASVSNAEAYAVGVLKNVCFDLLRAHRMEEVSEPPEEIPSPLVDSPQEELEQRDESRQLKELINRLPEQQRRVIRMHDLQEHSFEEIEKATGLSAVNIRVTLSRARKKIREQFKLLTDYEHR